MLLAAPRASATSTRFHEHASPAIVLLSPYRSQMVFGERPLVVFALLLPHLCARPRARFAPCTLVWHAGRGAHFAVPCARRRRVVPFCVRERQGDERPLWTRPARTVLCVCGLLCKFRRQPCLDARKPFRTGRYGRQLLSLRSATRFARIWDGIPSNQRSARPG